MKDPETNPGRHLVRVRVRVRVKDPETNRGRHPARPQLRLWPDP